MKLYLPHNIFLSILSGFLKEQQIPFEYQPSALLTGTITKKTGLCGFIPTMELLKNDEYFVSSKFGLSFDGQISNTYIYYKSEMDKLEKIRLFGDISSQEAILTSILFRELYDTNIKLEIVKEFNGLGEENYLLTGDINFSHGKLTTGFSFAEEIMEITELPYVNYVLASTEKEPLEQIHTRLAGAEEYVLNNVEKIHFPPGWDDDMKEYLLNQIHNVIYEFDESDIEGIKSQLRMPFYYGIIEDIIEPKFV